MRSEVGGLRSEADRKWMTPWRALDWFDFATASVRGEREGRAESGVGSTRGRWSVSGGQEKQICRRHPPEASYVCSMEEEKKSRFVIEEQSGLAKRVGKVVENG